MRDDPMATNLIWVTKKKKKCPGNVKIYRLIYNLQRLFERHKDNESLPRNLVYPS
jgi:hypothetical protein